MGYVSLPLHLKPLDILTLTFSTNIFQSDPGFNTINNIHFFIFSLTRKGLDRYRHQHLPAFCAEHSVKHAYMFDAATSAGPYMSAFIKAPVFK